MFIRAYPQSQLIHYDFYLSKFKQPTGLLIVVVGGLVYLFVEGVVGVYTFGGISVGAITHLIEVSI